MSVLYFVQAINKIRKAFDNAHEQLQATVKAVIAEDEELHEGRSTRDEAEEVPVSDQSILNTIVAIPDSMYDGIDFILQAVLRLWLLFFHSRISFVHDGE